MRQMQNSSSSNGCTLRQVHVANLFNTFNYTIDFDVDVPGNNTRILYGDNGSGKTTLLTLIYSALSTNHNEGNKTRLSQIPFSLLVITLSTNVRIEISKLSGNAYHYRIYDNDILSFDLVIKSTETNTVKLEDNPEIERLFSTLRRLSPDLLFITDDRQYFTTISQIIKYKSSYLEQPLKPIQSEYIIGLFDPTEEAAPSVIDRLTKIIRDVCRAQIIERGNFGQRNANQIYLDVIESISSKTFGGTHLYSKDELISFLRRLIEYSYEAIAIGAIPGVPFSKLEHAIQIADDDSIPAIAQIITPYLNGLEARIRATKEPVDRITSFVSELNRFYRQKHFAFSLSTGFSVLGLNDSEMSMNWLSSGEGQLFTVLGTVFLAQDSGGVVLIDEPELSLNIKWQREFVPALKRINDTPSIQYVLATHSLEILSGHERAVVPLSSR